MNFRNISAKALLLFFVAAPSVAWGMTHSSKTKFPAYFNTMTKRYIVAMDQKDTINDLLRIGGACLIVSDTGRTLSLSQDITFQKEIDLLNNGIAKNLRTAIIIKCKK